MTNAIEQAKRETYKAIAHLRGTITINYSIKNMLDSLNMFEGEMESYLELLRQDHEALRNRLAKMTEERDSIQLRLHAVDHAYNDQQSLGGTSGQTSVDRASYKATEANAEVIRAAARNIQLVITDWGMGDLKTKKAMRQIARIVNGDGTVGAALGEMEKSTTCMHSFHQCYGPSETCTYCGVAK